MVNFLIYTGTYVMIAGMIIAIIAGIKGLRLSGKGYDREMVKQSISKYVKIAFIIWGIGFAITGAGIAIGLN